MHVRNGSQLPCYTPLYSEAGVALRGGSQGHLTQASKDAGERPTLALKPMGTATQSPKQRAPVAQKIKKNKKKHYAND